MSFTSYNDPAMRRISAARHQYADDQPYKTPPPGLVMMPDGRAFLVEKGLRGGERVGSEGEDYEGGTDDWMWRDQKTGQEHYLSDYLSQGAKLYDTSEGGLSALLEREGRGVFNRGGHKQGDWGASMSNLDPSQVSGSQNYWDTAEMADDADSLGYLTRINPTARKQIFDAAGVSMPANTSALSSDDIAKLERTMYKIDPMSFGGGYTGEMGNEMYGQASMGGVDPLYGRATENPMGEYFRNIENLKFDPNYGLYNDGSAGFVKRKKQSALEQGMPFIMAAAALMGGAALLGPAMAGGAGAAGAVGTGAELGFGGMLADAGVTSGALEGLGGTVFSGGELFANGALNLTENAYANSAITGALKNAAMSGITGNDITAKGLLGGAALGAASPFISNTLTDAGVTGVLNKGLTGATTGGLGALINGGDLARGVVQGGLGGTVSGLTNSSLAGAGASYLAGQAMNQPRPATNAVVASTPQNPASTASPKSDRIIWGVPSWLRPRT